MFNQLDKELVWEHNCLNYGMIILHSYTSYLLHKIQPYHRIVVPWFSFSDRKQHITMQINQSSLFVQDPHHHRLLFIAGPRVYVVSNRVRKEPEVELRPLAPCLTAFGLWKRNKYKMRSATWLGNVRFRKVTRITICVHWIIYNCTCGC